VDSEALAATSFVTSTALDAEVLDFLVALAGLEIITDVNLNVNAPTEQAPAMAPPTRTDDQILPRSRWITPVNNNNPFSSPSTPDALINFVNNLGYSKVVRTLFVVVTNGMFQPCRALTTIINLCHTGKTLGFERPRAQTQEKKRKLATKTSNEPSLAKSSKPGLVTKRRKPTSSLRLVDEFVDEGIPESEPRFDDEEDDMQRAVEESLKSVHDAHQGPLPPVVFREPDSRKFQPLREIKKREKRKPNLEHMDLEATDVSTQQNPEQMDEWFTTTAYPNVQENLKLTVEEHMILEEPASSTGTLSSLQHLAKDFSFGDQFFNDKPSKVENKKTAAETKAKSMVSVTIHQDTSAIPPMTSPVIDLISKPDSLKDHWPLPATTTTTITTLPLPPQPQQGTTDSIFIKHIGELEQIMANLIQDNKHQEERVQMIMRFNEIHKFSDGTLHQIDEALDYRIKEFKVNMMNLGLNIRYWTRKDVDRSKEFMFAIQKQQKRRRIFRNLESFVGGRVREGDYRLLQRTE
nr:hypothetical protein [Tanacetum cinerariifolium]